MKKSDFSYLLLLVVVALILFYPVFYSEYLYTDEGVQLWNYKTGLSFIMFTAQGRAITEKLFYTLFSAINTIKDLRYLRLFSFLGWILCLPCWYIILKKIIDKEKLPAVLGFFTVLYLVTCPPFAISVYWASCMELFIANTCGLISGYILYAGIKYDGDRVVVPGWPILFSLLFGVVALFTYQNGFGCFFIPFIIHLLARKQVSKPALIGLFGYIFILAIYYLLFKYSLRSDHIGASARTAIYFDPLGKLQFFFAHPLTSAFHFSWLVNEESRAGHLISMFLFCRWLLITFLQSPQLPVVKRMTFLGMVVVMLVLIYFPALIVKENYASNRTLLALDIAVFILAVNTILGIIKDKRKQWTFVAIAGMLLVVCSAYNFRKQFLGPIEGEYRSVRSYLEKNYRPAVKTIYFIRASENTFRQKYGIISSWDEYGVPSTFFEWVPEYFVKQVVFEQTRDRSIADGLTIKNWPDKSSFLKSGLALQDSILLVEADSLIVKGRQ